VNFSWARVTFVLLNVPVKIDWVLFAIPFILLYWKPKYHMRGLGLLIGLLLHELAHVVMMSLFGIGIKEIGAGFLYAYVSPTVPVLEMHPVVSLLVLVVGPATNFVLGRVLSGEMADINSTLGFINILPIPGADGFFVLYILLACIFPGIGIATVLGIVIVLVVGMVLVFVISMLLEWRKKRTRAQL